MSEYILIIDDDEAFCRTLSRSLTRRGFRVQAVNNAQSAVEQSRQATFDRIVLDLKLGDASGLRLLPQLKQNQPDAALLVLTGYSSIPTAVEAIKRGAMNYLCKPADADNILAAFEGSEDTDADFAAERPSVKRLEWEHIQATLKENNGNISETARQLKMHRRTLQRKLQKRPTKE